MELDYLQLSSVVNSLVETITVSTISLWETVVLSPPTIDANMKTEAINNMFVILYEEKFLLTNTVCV